MPKTCPVCGTSYPDANAFCLADGTTLRADATDGDLVGVVIADRYRVINLLGEGGMGRVYLARHVRLPQQAAIKVLHRGMVADSAAVARFNREAANAARIEHERVARVFDFGETSDGLVYLAMEFVPGRTIRAILDEGERVPPVRVANLVYQIADGLEAAHRIGIVHRDLKPDNILVMTDEHGVDRCKVVDFGIAKAVDSRETQLTQAGMLVGTPEYMSPEQVLGEPIDGRSDVYALALVAYELFAGALPFASGSAERSMTARLIDSPRPLRTTAPAVDWPFALQLAFDVALQREPNDRTASALYFAESVVNVVEEWTGVSVLRSRTPLSTQALSSSAREIVPAAVTPPARGAVTERAAAPAASQPTASDPAARAAAPSSRVVLVAPAPSRSRASLAYALVGLVAVLGGAVAMWPGRGGTDPGGAQKRVPPAVVSTQGLVVPAPTKRTPSRATGERDASPPSPPSPAGADVPGGSVPSEALSSASDAQSAPAVKTGPSDAGRALEVAAAKRELSALTSQLEAADDNPALARTVIARLNELLPRFDSAADSTWTYIYLASAYGMADDLAGACTPLRSAIRLARTERQHAMIRQLTSAGGLTCAP